MQAPVLVSRDGPRARGRRWLLALRWCRAETTGQVHPAAPRRCDCGSATLASLGLGCGLRGRSSVQQVHAYALRRVQRVCAPNGATMRARDWLTIVAALSLAAALHFAGGCGGPIGNATPEQEAATVAALELWESTIAPAPACWEARADLRWLELDGPGIVRACGRTCGELQCLACTLTNYDGEATIVAPLGQPGDSHAHELVHWLARCSGHEPHGDHDHADPALWIRRGAAASAEPLELAIRRELAQVFQ